MTGSGTLWHGEKPLVLASGSAARRAMLAAAGVPVDLEQPDVDERFIETQLAMTSNDPAMLATGLAIAKAVEVSQRLPGRLVLGGDQVLTYGVDHQKLHKPRDVQAAAQQLALLAGQTHRLTSAAAIVRDGQVLGTCADHALMTMRGLSSDEISAYLDAAGPAILSSVGCYHIEGLGVHLFETIAGDHFTIQGLPLLAVLGLLRRVEVLA